MLVCLKHAVSCEYYTLCIENLVEDLLKDEGGEKGEEEDGEDDEDGEEWEEKGKREKVKVWKEEDSLPSQGGEEEPVTPRPACPKPEGNDARGTAERGDAPTGGRDTERSQGVAIPLVC